MYYLFIKAISDYLFEIKKIRIENRERFEIFLEYLVSLTINLFIAIGVGYTIKMQSELVVFGLSYTLLRTSVGGCYYKLNIKDSFITWIMGISIIMAMNYLIEYQTTIILSILMIVFSIGMTIVLSRINMHDIDISLAMKNNIKFRSVVMIMVESFVLLFGFATVYNSLVIAGIVGIFSQSMMIIQWLHSGECLVEVRNFT